MVKFLLFTAGLIVGLFLAQPAMAAEPICPGGANPRSDIVWCGDFENLTNCTTGAEFQCWVDNGFSNTYGNATYGFKIVSGTAAVGTGYVKANPRPGSSGNGPGGVFFQNRYQVVNFRYYARFSAGFLTFESGHGPGVLSDSANGTCPGGGIIKFQNSTYANHSYYAIGCGVTSHNLDGNQPNLPVMYNNRWYLIEMHAAMDTACTDPSSTHGCNGVYRVWIDGQLVTEFTDVNFGGVTNQMRWSGLSIPSNYYHKNVPPWSYELAFDNAVLSGNGTAIGPAQNENPRGTPDLQSPYRQFNGLEAFQGHRSQGDCATNLGYLGIVYGQPYRTVPTIQTSVVHNGYPNGCDTPPTDSALVVNLTQASEGSGIYWDVTDVWPQLAVHGWVYLPSSNNYGAISHLVLTNVYADYWNSLGGYVGISLSNGKWAIKQRYQNGTPQTMESTTSVTFDTWHEYELIVWNDQTVSLMIDHTRVYNKAALPLPVSGIFAQGTLAGMVVGVPDFQGTAPFTAYFDDVNLGTVSFWSCDGWNASSCPFTSQVAGPSPPTGLRVE